MKVYLANLSSVYKDFRAKLDKKLFVLESFYYVKPWMYKNIETKWDFLLDSGAFTFMVNASKSVDWDEYVSEYAAFINKHNVKHFFELDIDNVVGLKEVERLRTKVEILTKKKCIPVWHKSRGKQYWIDMTKEYDYVAIGGIVTKEIKRKEHDVFKWFIESAKKNNCKVHALGYTSLRGLRKYPFYSVDSTSWLCGNISGSIYRFNGSSLTTSKSTGRLKPKLARENNLNEWIKFQRYAEHNL